MFVGSTTIKPFVPIRITFLNRRVYYSLIFVVVLQLWIISNITDLTVEDKIIHVQLKRVSNEMYIFEAASNYGSNEVTVITASPQTQPPEQSCLFCVINPSSPSSCLSTGHAKAEGFVPYKQRFEMIARLFTCRVPEVVLKQTGFELWDDFWTTFRVNVTLTPTASMNFNYLPPTAFSTIQYQRRARQRGQITVCSGPYFGYSDMPVEHLMEWTEYQMWMGVDIVRFYATKDLSTHYLETLMKYTKMNKILGGKVEVVMWDYLPEKMRYRSQHAIYQHCALTSKTEWFGLMDMDEFVFVPPRDKVVENNHPKAGLPLKPWQETILSKYFTNDSVVSFRFKTWFHDANCLRDINEDDRENNRFRLDRVWIRMKEHVPYGREKYFARADKVRFFGIHALSDPFIDINPTEAYIVHLTTRYVTKNCDLKSDKRGSHEHPTMQFIGNEMRRRVNKRRRQFETIELER